MSKGHYKRKKKNTGLLVFLLIVVLLLLIVLGGYIFIDAKLSLIRQAKLEEKNPVENLDALIGNLDETIAQTEAIVVEEQIESESSIEEATETETVSEVTQPLISDPAFDKPVDYGETGKIINIMVVGQDYREDEGHKLADTIMLFTINKETTTLTLTSFQRDSYVQLPPEYRGRHCGWNRINTSYALGYSWYGDVGAMEMLDLTILNNFGVEVDGNVEIGLDAFEIAIDILNGVDIDLYDAELDYMNNYAEIFRTNRVFVEGTNHLNGQEALWYARMRKSSPADNDFYRTARQRLIVDKVLEKCKSMNILQLNELLDKLLPLIITDISTEMMKVYIRELLPYVFDLKLETNQCPAEHTWWGEIVDLPDGPGSVLKMDFEANKKILKEICG